MRMSSDSSEPAGTQQPRDAAYWARQSANLRVSEAPVGAINLNVDGRTVAGPLQGFGKMWRKTYSAQLTGCDVTPQEVIATWKAHFPEFWPKGNRFYIPITGIAPGEVALLNLRAGGMPLSTGVLVLYADDESFTLMTPQGHMFAGMITFSAESGPTCAIAQADVLMRASDPIFEMGLQFGGHRQEDIFWQHTLTALATRFGVQRPQVETRVVCVDPKRQWRYMGNVWHNSALRTLLIALWGWIGRGQNS